MASPSPEPQAPPPAWDTPVPGGLTIVVLAQGETMAELAGRLDEIAADLRAGTSNARCGDDYDYQVNRGALLVPLVDRLIAFYQATDANRVSFPDRAPQPPTNPAK